MKKFLLSIMLMVVMFPLTMKAQEIIVGQATDVKNVAPFVNSYPYSWCEIVYQASEIGQACNIETIAFQYAEGPTLSTDEIRIYLAETTKTEFADKSQWTAESELTLVYTGTDVVLGDTEWEIFELETPFEYSGENNLAVVVAKAAANLGFSNWDLKWRCYDAANSIMFTASDTDVTFAQYPVADGLATYGKKPVMKLTWSDEPIAPEKPAAPTNLGALVEQDVEGYDYKFRITVMWDAVEGAELYDVYVNTATESDFYMGFSSGPYYIIGTNNETTFEYYVKTVIGEVESDPSEIYTVVVEDNGSGNENDTTSLVENKSVFNIYPNPVEDKLYINIDTDSDADFDVVIYNVNGQRVEGQQSTVKGQQTVNVSDLNSGVYFVKVRTNKGETVRQFIKK